MARGYRSNETVIGLLLKENKMWRKKRQVRMQLNFYKLPEPRTANIQLVHQHYQYLHQYNQEGY